MDLADGRRLAFSTLGPSGGFPVLYMHGAVGSALAATPELRDLVDRLGLRWVCVSRPGFGGSDPHPGKTMLSFAADVQELADAQGWNRIAVVGVSTGGPYALACAHLLAELVGAVAITASLSPQCAPYSVPGLPLATRLFMRVLAAAPRSSARLLGVSARLLRAHQALVVRLAGPARAPAVGALSAATVGGVGGLVDDFVVCCRPWGFDPAELGVEVHLWHGLRDRLVPADHARQLAAALPRCRAAIDPDENHFFFRRRSPEITELVVEAARRSALVGAAG